MKSFKDFYDEYIRVRKKYTESNMILHFRIKTHGNKDKTNCHPFKVNEDLVFCHNGIISDVEGSQKYSDTIMFNKTILRKLPNGFVYNKPTLKLMEEFIGSSKLIFLTSKNEIVIVNEDAGEYNKKGWFSNNSWKQRNNYVWAGNTKIYNSGRSYAGYYGGRDFGSGCSDDDEVDCWNESFSSNTETIIETAKQCKICSSYLYTQNEEDCGVCNHCRELILEAAVDYNLIDRNECFSLQYGTLIPSQEGDKLVELEKKIRIAEGFEVDGSAYTRGDVHNAYLKQEINEYNINKNK